jgi:hypothetical protein
MRFRPSESTTSASTHTTWSSPCDWPDVTTLDRSRLPELKRLADAVTQTGDAKQAPLYLEKAEL